MSNEYSSPLSMGLDNKPTKGLIPRHIWLAERNKDLREALSRYLLDDNFYQSDLVELWWKELQSNELELNPFRGCEDIRTTPNYEQKMPFNPQTHQTNEKPFYPTQ